MKTRIPRLIPLVLWGLLALAGIAACSQPQPAEPPAEPPPPLAGIGPVDYWRDVQPILERRCIVCHGCYDAPCQLNLSAYQGIARGAHQKKVYDTTRLIKAEPTRLFDDAQSTAGWRKKGFFPVLHEPAAGHEPPAPGDPANLAGVMARMLELKRRHPLPAASPLPEKTFDFSLDRKQQCPAEDTFDEFAHDHPQWGMPYGLPSLTGSEEAVLLKWLQDGAPYREPEPLPEPVAQRVRDWEDFLNGDSLKHQLMSRYVYEHLFLAALHFADLPERRFFRLVRSRTAPGMPVEVIATRRPYDDPGPATFYYRLQPLPASLLAKTHIPYGLSPARQARWRELFLDAPYDAKALPSYEPAVASNPFIAFRDLPVATRYKFLLDDAGVFVAEFIKGPVCRGQIALDVIEERFWIFFMNPDSPLIEENGEFLARESKHLWLPTEEGATPLGLASWIKYSEMQKAFLKAKQAYMEEHRQTLTAAGIEIIWNGDGKNQNAALTVFRHLDSATVVRGLAGTRPKTSVVLTYQLLERIYYLLVAGFDVYGFMGHQLDTRLYMDFLRMEGEFNFLMLLPKGAREKERDFWYRDAHQSVKDYVYGSRIHFDGETAIAYKTKNPKTELFDLLHHHLAGALNPAYGLETEPDAEIRAQLEVLTSIRGKNLGWMPDVTFLAVTETPEADVQNDRVYTLIRDIGYSNIASLLDNEGRRRPDEDALTVTHGFVGAYPNAFYRVDRANLPQFVAAVAGLTSEQDYRKLAERFAVRRTSPDFWEHSDDLHRAYRTTAPLEAGLFDYNRLENR